MGTLSGSGTVIGPSLTSEFPNAFVIGIEDALDVAVQSSQHSDTCMHQEVATFGGADPLILRRPRPRGYIELPLARAARVRHSPLFARTARRASARPTSPPPSGLVPGQCPHVYLRCLNL
jgi:hypothetical protein